MEKIKTEGNLEIWRDHRWDCECYDLIEYRTAGAYVQETVIPSLPCEICRKLFPEAALDIRPATGRIERKWYVSEEWIEREEK